MKITNRGFSITEIDAPGIKGIDVTGTDGEESIAIVGEPGTTVFTLTREQWRAFTAAVTTVNERLGEAPGALSGRKPIIDGDGDRWMPIEGTDFYEYSDMRKTRERIEETYGIRQG